MLRVLLNVLWMFLGGGLVSAFEYFVGGVLLCLTVVGIPFGLQAFKLARLMLTPFGMEFRDDPTSQASGTLGLVMNVVWFLVVGLATAITHLGLAFGLAVTVVGIPFALQHAKFALLALFPFGKKVVDVA
jgi:uncharacterized membrane protein YccF (DUF307 family)